MSPDNRIDLREFNSSQEKFLTIVVTAAYANRLERYLEDINDTHINSKSFEIVILINKNDELEEKIKTFQEHYKFEIRYAITEYNYGQGCQNFNHGAFVTGDKNTYFVMANSDRFRFSIKGWDVFLRQYVGFVPDNMFFLRTTYAKQDKFPRKSLWDAFCVNETWGVYTRKMLEATGGFPQTPHLASHDCGYEMLYYYIKKNSKDRVLRDIAIPLLNENFVVTSEVADGQKKEPVVAIEEVGQQEPVVNNIDVKYKNLLSSKIDVTEHSEGKTLFASRASYFFFGARTDFFNRRMISDLKYHAYRFIASLKNEFVNGNIVKDEKNKLILIKNEHGKIVYSKSYKATNFEIYKNRLSVRFTKFFNPYHFIVSLYPILTYPAGIRLVRKLIYYTTKNSNLKNRLRSILIAKPLLILIKLIFQVPKFDNRQALTILNDVNIYEGLLFNDEFKKNYKEHFKFLGYFTNRNSYSAK